MKLTHYESDSLSKHFFVTNTNADSVLKTMSMWEMTRYNIKEECLFELLVYILQGVQIDVA